MRVAFAAALATTCAAAAAACTLSDVYSSEYGEEAGSSLDGGLDASVDATTDATTDGSVAPPDDAMTSDASSEAAPDFDAGDATSCQTADPGPYGDYCLGVPAFVTPFEDATVGLTFAVQVEAPCCIRDMQMYIEGTKVGPIPIAGDTYTGTVTVAAAGSYVINVNGWDKTNDAHASPHVTFNVVATH